MAKSSIFITGTWGVGEWLGFRGAEVEYQGRTIFRPWLTLPTAEQVWELVNAPEGTEIRWPRVDDQGYIIQ